MVLDLYALNQVYHTHRIPARLFYSLVHCIQSERCNSNVANGNARFGVPFPALYRPGSCTLAPSLFVLSIGCIGCIYMYAFL